MSGADAGQLGGYRSQTQVLTMRRWSLNVLNDRRHDFEVRAAGVQERKHLHRVRTLKGLPIHSFPAQVRLI